jgi:glycosyltransferase involved in cell wall biosynthesis
MRLLYLVDNYLPSVGGAEILVAQTVEAQLALGYDITVVTPKLKDGPNEDILRPNFRLLHHRLMMRTRSGGITVHPVAAMAYAKMRAAFRPDIVHIHYYGPAFLLELLTRSQVRVPLVVTAHTPLTPHYSAAMATLLRVSDRLLAINDLIHAEYLVAAPEVAPSVQKLALGIAPAPVAPAPLPFAPPVILCIGRLVKEKGFDLAIRALLRVRTEIPAARLIIAGAGEQLEALQALAAELGLTGAVHFAGLVHGEEKFHLYNQATVVAITSRWEEPSPLVARETAQMGRPAVAAATGGIPALVLDGQTGVLFERDNPDALAAALLDLLLTPAKAEELGRNAALHAQRAFGMERYVREHDELYRALIATRINNESASVSSHTK